MEEDKFSINITKGHEAWFPFDFYINKNEVGSVKDILISLSYKYQDP